MSAGIYMNNGVLAYSMDLEKKLKRRKQAIIIEEYKGDLTGDLLEKQLQIMLNKHVKLTQEKTPERIEYEEPEHLRYHWRNKVTKHTLHSIYPTLDNIPNIKKEEWEAYEE